MADTRPGAECAPRAYGPASTALSTALAELARSIRDRITEALANETEQGPLTRLLSAFRESLVDDLDAEGFADMYAQTIAYGLLSTRLTSPGGDTVDHLHAQVPITNPFLRELMAGFLHPSERNGIAGGIDFDELGVSEVVDLLDDANMEAVVRDFGERNPLEDPVIHFYELFLSEYDANTRMQRGVFYTPRPVVSYIVRAIDRLLVREFGLADGLADTSTWHTVASRQGLVIPEGVDAASPFVQILDPATGTGTFLVEVIDTIFRRMTTKWTAAGRTEAQRRALWDEYVAHTLLPRLHGFELMMAPYAIAHLKVGVKLLETGYGFHSDQRVRVYLTNALEPPRDFSDRLELAVPALAHEAQAVNRIKSDQRFTVVLGNPPYSKISSNLTPQVRATVERYRYVGDQKIRERGALQFEINLQDDYVKFVRLCETALLHAGAGVLGLITNNGYLSAPTLRGMRDSLLRTHDVIRVVDLHGHIAKGEVGPHGEPEQNVFDILQGVGIFVGVKRSASPERARLLHADCFGTRQHKSEALLDDALRPVPFSPVEPTPPFYLFLPQNMDLAAEWRRFVGLTELFPSNSAGVITARDRLVLDEDPHALAERLERFSRSKAREANIYEEFGFKPNKRFDLREAQAALRRLESFSDPVRPVLYRPFDVRYIFYDPNVVWSMARPMAAHLEDGKNLALVATRQVTRTQYEHAFVSRHLIEIKACSHDRNTQVFPLYLRTPRGELSLYQGDTPNLDPRSLQALEVDADPEGVFGYVYAVLHSPRYRTRYFEFLRSEFPRIPMTPRPEIFVALRDLGQQLIGLHLLESPALSAPAASYTGSPEPRVGRVVHEDDTIWLDGTTRTHGFEGVSKESWDFYIGGYRVCHKWLKDRRGRQLSDADIRHFLMVLDAVSRTQELMRQIDAAIDEHGGWPSAFACAQERPSLPPTTAPERTTGTEARPEPTTKSGDASGPVFSDKSEGMCAIRRLFSDGRSRSRDTAIDQLCESLGATPAGSAARSELRTLLRTAVRRGIVGNEDGELVLLCRTIEGYDQDFLSEQLLASMPHHKWTPRDDITRAFARWMGFRRTGRTVATTARSLVDALIGQGRLECEGDRVRR